MTRITLQQDVLGKSEQELLPDISEQKLLTDNTEQATEHKLGENYVATQKPTSEGLTGEPVLQTARNDQFAPHQDISLQDVKSGLTSTDNAELYSPKARKHYRAGHIALDEVSAWVSLDLFGIENEAERLTPTVRAVLEELAPAKERVGS